MIGIIYNLYGLCFWIFLLFFINRKFIIIRDGVLLGSLVSIFYTLIVYYKITLATFIYRYALSAPIEEVIKLMPILFYEIKNNMTPYDFYIYGASVGLGFAFIENMLYLDNPSILMARNVSSNFISIFTSIILSISVYKYKNTNKIHWLIFIILSMIIHYAYNYLV